MKNYFYLIPIFFLISCGKGNLTHPSKDTIKADSITFLYKISKNEKVSLDLRRQKINQALALHSGIENDTVLTKILFQKNLIHLGLREYDSLLFYNHQLSNLASEIKDEKILAAQFYLMGYYYAEVLNSYDKAIENYTDSKFYYQQLNDSSNIGRNLLNIGTIQKDQNDFFGSKETITEALQFLSPAKDLKYITHCYNVLATNNRKLLNFEEAVKYYTKAIEYSNSVNDKVIYQNNLAATYLDNKEYKDAISLLKTISKDSILNNNQKQYARVLDNLAYAQWLSGSNIKEKQFQHPLKIRAQIKDQRGKIASYTHLGEFHSSTNTKRAIAYFDSVVQLSKNLKIPRAEKDVLKLLMNLEPNNLIIRNRYVFLQDSLYNQELRVKTQFAKYKYDDKLKQESILRLEKDNAEHKLEVAQQRNQKIQSYAIGGLLLALSGFAIYFFAQRSKRLRQQNKTAKLEATFETEAELSRKLHDDFGGKLNHTMLLLQNGADNSEILNVVDGLYNQSRNFSREINDVDTGPNFKEFLFGMMGNYCNNTKLMVTGSSEVDWLKISILSKKTLFKALQELMINMQKHSGASLVSVTFKQSKDTLKLSYLDNGAGATKDSLNIKNGLWNTEKRIKAIGGTIIFDSEKGRGFEAQIEIPN
ncbi:hypothetical protein JQC67_02665 [Aurantibacter crassamenti]|uniref:tetratricopeptide repeat-containing sensor histidine kinase n=1 Tax=Aurantibacter crassamenti TaxID=1837375 RepID=UPI0019399FF8|nr:hypothetical protein [Aurantibacter crassamenti]MBM1105033.1 hypothetical protein [Aurantibacter crassamenti]